MIKETPLKIEVTTLSENKIAELMRENYKLRQKIEENHKLLLQTIVSLNSRMEEPPKQSINVMSIGRGRLRR